MVAVFKPFHVFDELAKRFDRFVLAYSGGKDSTAVAILLYQWIKTRRSNVDVVVMYSDTLSEINTVEAWARQFMDVYVHKLRDYVDARAEIVAPLAVNTYFWLVFVRGYAAPTFNFRWCVTYLKLKPAEEVMKRMYDNAVVITGLRDSESPTRSGLMKKRFKACSPGSCLGAYLSERDVAKAAPIRGWSEEDVWRFLATQRDFDVTPLFALYRVEGFKGLVRYGCWHCTLVKIQPGLYLNEKLLYVEALRLIHRAISDLPKYRMPKPWGYSKLGALTAEARAVIYHLAPAVEELSGHRFYGLDEARIDGATLREVFYNYTDAELDKIVARTDNTSRWVGASKLRQKPQLDSDILETLTKIDPTGLATEKAKELFTHIAKT